MTGPIEERIAAIAARQHGVVARARLLAEGMSPAALDSLVRAGRLHPLHRGVYLLGPLRGRLQPPRAREMAAVLAGGRGAVLSHVSAAHLWELLPARARGSAAEVDITVPGHARRHRPGIRIHRRSDHDPAEATRLAGIPVTTPARTLRDLSSLVSVRELNRAAARAERRKLIRREDLHRLVACQRGRPGAPVLRAALADPHGLVFTRSEAEARLDDLIRLGDLPAPEMNIVILGYELDCYWRAQRVAVEVDGFEHHSSWPSFERDHRRDNDFAAAGVMVLRVTWRQLVGEPHRTLVRIAQALARADGSR